MNKNGSYVKLDNTLFYGIHPAIVKPDFEPDHYIILTEDHEFDYHKLDNMIFYPIKDRKSVIVNELDKIVNKILALNGTIYIACKGGHGRSGLIAAAVYSKKYKKDYNYTLKYINKEWSKQRDMTKIRPFIRKLGSPQTSIQKKVLKDYIGNQ
jgi:hypothetical protein